MEGSGMMPMTFGKKRCREQIPLPGYKDTLRAYTYCQRDQNHTGPHSPNSEQEITANANFVSRPAK